MQLEYCEIANLVAGFHLVWDLCLVSIFVVPRYYRVFCVIHGGIVLITAASWWRYPKQCILVTIENALRDKCVPNNEQIPNFIPHYVEKWFDIYVDPKLVVIMFALIALTSVTKLILNRTSEKERA